ncbi:RNA helicase aquarius [Aethina tumida]|uniref:RNA helicase aquarius n=1 Tax=Aethina tumida TaxID=116153 RepID=UPI002147A15E|nr:RNA helicase aquarius [Aethina tumida]
MAGKPTNTVLSVSEIKTDRITELAEKYWAPNTKQSHLKFDGDIIEKLYLEEIRGTNFSIRRIMILEFGQYLENYLWPNYNQESSYSHLLSIVTMINEKFRERVEVWNCFRKFPDNFPYFFQHVMKACLEDDLIVNTTEKTALLVFLNHCFNSMEETLIRDQVKRLVSLSMWCSLQENRREMEFKRCPKWRKYWKLIQKKDKKENKEGLLWERTFLHKLMLEFLRVLDSIEETGICPKDKVNYCERFLELLTDLEALLPTRRFFNTVLDDCHLVVRCQLSGLIKRKEGHLFSQLLDMLKFYTRFEISDESGDPLTDHDMTQIHYSKITSLQKAVFAKFPDLRSFALANVASVDNRTSLKKHFGALGQDKLRQIAEYLNLVPTENLQDKYKWIRLDEEFLRELLIFRHEKRSSQLETLNEMPLYPTEDIIWDENVVPTAYFSGEGCLALPKLNLQFLTLHDYLLRNFNLFRLESTYEIRQDIEDAVSRLCPWKSEDGSVYFGGWARMAQPITAFAVVEVAKPNIGENRPSRVRADVTVNLNVRPEIKSEWENLRKHDVCFLITVQPPNPIGTKYDYKLPFVPQVGLKTIRGCEIEGMLDANGRVIEDGPEPRPNLPGDQRTFRVWLDCNQYTIDMNETNKGKEDIYEGFNILMRRKPKENNFKAVLETIRELMNTECVVPSWLHDIVLGYGDPAAAHYSQLNEPISTMDFNDTFIDLPHLRECFPDYEIKLKNVDDPKKIVRPFKLTFHDLIKGQSDKILEVEPHVVPRRGPYCFNEPKRNSIHFTATQVEAIKSGMQPGLTLVVGPPGTGKTDVAVQIISNIYHNFPNQRTLIVTHSNQALNQLFDKIVTLDIDERHLLRLGHGEENLETEKDFSRYGRVNYVLAKRLDLLQQVQKLQESLKVAGDVAYTCETAGHFYLYQILSRWEHFQSVIKSKPNNVKIINEEFPFHEFFNDAPQPLFKQENYEEDLEVAESCFRYIKHIFQELEEFRAFELLRSGLDRSKYLLVKEAKIIAMTCTHAALKRKELVEIGFKYDNILMEESAQILEIETFIPLLLQNPQDGFNRLKRWIMIGDHHQLPPVIKNMAFQKYSNMEQSLFTRLVRLGVPTVDLDGQGRARPSICNLYKWRYKSLGNLKHVESWQEYKKANAGFAFDFQLIDVQDFNGVGESEPSPYFYQNLAEAEYVVAVFMFMRLIGYPAHKITILTTYNGQKHLIRDVINTRCANNPLIGKPHKITTVDKYQGQQNDYILLSLVRTKAVGHLRDVRRLVVAMSRSRLGLYVFARVSLFENCFELTPAFQQLTKRPVKLHLVLNELFPTERNNFNKETGTENNLVIEDMTQMANFVYSFYIERRKQLEKYYECTRWEKPGGIEIKTKETFDSKYEGEDREDSEDEEEKGGKMIPQPIQDEPIEDRETMEVQEQEDNQDESRDESQENRDESQENRERMEVTDTGEAENDE